MKGRWTMLGVLAMLAACEGKDAPSSVSEPTQVSPAPGAEPAASGQAKAAELSPVPEELPVPADFEEDAERSITAANYKSELDALSAEIREDAR